MAIFITVQTGFPPGAFRLNVDHIVSYTQSEHPGPLTNITLSTGGSITVTLRPEQLDDLITKAGARVFLSTGVSL